MLLLFFFKLTESDLVKHMTFQNVKLKLTRRCVRIELNLKEYTRSETCFMKKKYTKQWDIKSIRRERERERERLSNITKHHKELCFVIKVNKIT